LKSGSFGSVIFWAAPTADERRPTSDERRATTDDRPAPATGPTTEQEDGEGEVFHRLSCC